MSNTNYLLSIGFSVVAPEGVDPAELPPAVLKAALMRRVQELDRDGEWREAVMDGFDSYETDEEVTRAPLVTCPQCGADEDDLREYETCNVFHDIHADEGGDRVLWIHSSDGDVDWDGNNDSRLQCFNCGHNFPIPSGIDVATY